MIVCVVDLVSVVAVLDLAVAQLPFGLDLAAKCHAFELDRRGTIRCMMTTRASLHGATFGEHFHACAFTTGSGADERMIDRFLAEGMGRGAKAVYIVDPAERDACEERLAPAAPSAELLEVTTWYEAHLKGGAFDAPRMMDALEEMIRDNAATGRAPMRLVGNMGWVTRTPPPSDDLVEYEATVNEVLNRGRTPTVCVYQLGWISSTLMINLLRAHPLAVVNGALYENPFYTPARTLIEELALQRLAS